MRHFVIFSIVVLGTLWAFDVYALACRRREAQSGSCTERENLAGDAKGKGASGSNREAQSTDAPERGALPRSSYEAG